MIELIFASSNPNKAREIQAALTQDYSIIPMKQVGYKTEIPEPFQTLEENAMHKATTVANALNVNCFAEDTGLETEALGGAPGVRTARYAGEKANDYQNIEKHKKNYIDDEVFEFESNQRQFRYK
jgi:XTP/dITP diphosphohydrolase